MQSAPSFTAGPRGWFWLEPAFPARQRTTLLGAISGQFSRLIAYDANGRKWLSKGINSSYQRTWWRVLLANTVYNPRMTIDLVWSEPVPYALDELKRAYVHAVDLDDDILTQFVDAPELKERILLAQSFDELVAVYEWMTTDNLSEDAA
jgi:hypothetical protein